jgi:hypothetical protein
MIPEKANTMRRLTYWLVATGFFSALLIIFAYTQPQGCHNLLTAFSPETISVVAAAEKDQEATISEFRVQGRYKAVRLIWEAGIPEKKQRTFEIYRSMARPDGEYTLVTSIQGTPGVTKYEYIDKTVPVEENYFYKIEIPETKEAFGPLQARPPFSAPST